MSKFQVKFYWASGEVEEDDNDGMFYNSEEEATNAGLYGLSCANLGAEELELNNSGDYPYDESYHEDSYFEVEEI